MWKYILRRILQLIPAFIIVSFVVYWLLSMAGDPASVIAGSEATEEQILAIRDTAFSEEEQDALAALRDKKRLQES